MPNHNQTSLQLLAIFILFLYILQPAFAHNKNKTSDGSKNSSGGGGGSVGGSGNVQVSVSLKGSFSQVIAFGDSYTDTGNCMFMNGLRRFFGGIIANSPYGSIFKSPKNGNRFCDGRLVIDFLCEALGLPHLPPYKDPKVNVSGGVNFAVSGSTSLTSELFSKYKIGQGLLWKSMVSQNFLTQLDWFDEFIQKMVASGGGGWGTGSQRGSGQIGGGSSGGFGGGGSGGGGFGGGGGAGGGGVGGFGGGGGNIGGFGGGGGSTGGFGGGGASGFGGGGGNTGGFGGGIIGGGSGSGQIGGGASGSSGGQIGGSGQGGGSASGSGQIGGTGSGQAGGGASGSGQIGGSGGGHTGGGASGSGQIGGNGGGQASGGQASGGQAGGSTSGSGQIGGGASGSGQIGGSGGGQAGGSASGNGQIGGSGGGQAGGGASGSGGGKAGGGASGSGHIGGSGGGQAGGGASGSGQIGGSGGGQAAGGASGSGQISGGGNGQTSIDFSKILVWIGEMGVNDYARIITSSSLTGNWFSQISVNQVAKILTGVLEKGAKYLVVQGLPPVGCLPIALSHVPNSDRDEHGCSASINNLVKLHNQLQVQEPLKACCGASSGAFNFSPKQLCGAGSTGKCSDPSKYIVWDGLHLTEAMHKHLAELFFDKGYCHPSIPEMIAQKNKSLLDMLVDGSFAVPDDILQHLHFELQLYFVWRSIFAGGFSW